MLTSFPELFVGKRGSRVYWTLVTHGLHPAVISIYAYLCSLCQSVAVAFVYRVLLRVTHFIYLGSSLIKEYTIHVFVDHAVTHTDAKTMNSC